VQDTEVGCSTRQRNSARVLHNHRQRVLAYSEPVFFRLGIESAADALQ